MFRTTCFHEFYELHNLSSMKMLGDFCSTNIFKNFKVLFLLFKTVDAVSRDVLMNDWGQIHSYEHKILRDNRSSNTKSHTKPVTSPLFI